MSELTENVLKYVKENTGYKGGEKIDWVLVCPSKLRQTRPQIERLALSHPCWLIVVAGAHSQRMAGNVFFPTWTDQERLKWSGILYHVCSLKISLKLLDHLLFLFCLQTASAYLY